MTGIEDVEDDGRLTEETVFSNKIFRNIVLSLAATYGLYIIASLLALDPWHMRELSGLTDPEKADAFGSHELLAIPSGELCSG